MGKPEITILPSSVFQRLLRFFFGGSDDDGDADDDEAEAGKPEQDNINRWNTEWLYARRTAIWAAYRKESKRSKNNFLRF